MSEFKVNKSLSSEISNLRDSGNAVNDGYKSISSDNVSTLKTSTSILAQHESIKSLLDLYKSLVLKDAQDLDDMVAEANEMDAKIAASNKA